MSGDVQPRKRKDKKKKRDDEASHGVHITKMGSDDVHLHVHEEHGTGGHWCAKVIFFSLMTILMGLVCLIILENRGLSDVDTPLSESRFSNYFDGWVDEHRGDHDDHHDKHGSLGHDDHDDDEHDDDHDDDDDHEDDDHDDDDDDDDHDEPLEEEVDHSEGDDEAEEDDDDNVTPEEEDDEDDDNDGTQENNTAEADDDDDEDDDNDNATVEEDGQDDDDATAENDADDVDDNVTAETEADDDDDDNTAENEATLEDNDDDDDDDGDANDTNEEDDNVTVETSKPASNKNNDDDDDDDDPFDEEDDDGTFESIEKVVDNDAAELELLKEKARQQAAAEAKNSPASVDNDNDDEADNAPSWASSKIKPKTGGGGPQSLEDDDSFEQKLREANDEMMREHYVDALKSFDQLIQKYPNEPQTYLGKAQALDHYADEQKSNRLLKEALEYYKTYLEFRGDDNNLQEYRSAGERCVDRMRFIGQFRQALPIHQLLIQQFPLEPSLRNELAVTYLLQNRLLDAKTVLQETLHSWPENGFALVLYGYVLTHFDQDYHNAIEYFRKGIATNEAGTQDGRFYLALGECLQRMGRQTEAVEVFRKGADLKLFDSIYQRSLYNEPHLKAQPFWSVAETTYGSFFKKLEDNWLAIQAEGLNILSKTGYFQDESENLKNTGDWKQFELYARGQQYRQNCMKAPITCNLIAEFPAARDCVRGQVKFSVMHEGTHVWPHCGPTNCRIRAHLGLVVPQGTRIRVAEEERSWQEGKFLIFDDSFEHEVWHEGDGLRLVLIVDVWHPDLSELQRRSLDPI